MTKTTKTAGLFHFGWVVLLAATFYLNFTVDGYTFIFGIYRIELEKEYPNYSPWQVSIIGGLVPSLNMALAPIGIAVTEFIGPCRAITCASLLSTGSFLLAWANSFFKGGFIFDLFTLGIFQGLSSALILAPSIAVIVDYFPEHQRSLATGITTCGTPTGAILYAFIVHPLFQEYGWRGSLPFIAAFSLNSILCAMPFRVSRKFKETKANVRKTEPTRETLDFAKVLKKLEFEICHSFLKNLCIYLDRHFNAKLVFQPSFLCILVSGIFASLGYIIPLLLITAQSQKPEYGVDVSIQENLILTWAVFNCLGRFVAGRLADWHTKWALCTSFSIFIIGNSVAAVALFIFPHLMSLGNGAFIAFVIVHGFFIAPMVTLRSVIVGDLYGAENASASFGWLVCIQGVVAVLGFILPTWLDSMDALYAYVFGGVTYLLSAGFVGLTFKPYFLKRRNVIIKATKRCGIGYNELSTAVSYIELEI